MFSDRFAINPPQAPGPRVTTEGIPRNLFNQPLIEPSQVELVPQGSGAMLRLVPSRRGKDGKAVPLTADELRAAAQADPSRFSGAAIRDSENRLIDSQAREAATREFQRKFDLQQEQWQRRFDLEKAESAVRKTESDARLAQIQGSLEISLRQLTEAAEARKADNQIQSRRADTESIIAENQGDFLKLQGTDLVAARQQQALAMQQNYQLAQDRLGFERQQFDYEKEQGKKRRVAGYLGLIAAGLDRLTF